jgi:hypothetical protein
MALTPQQEIELIDTAITELMAGNAQSYSIGSRSVTKLNLSDLYERKTYLERLIDRQNGNGVRIGNIFRSR